MPWGYGQAWDSTAINAGLCPAGEQPGFFGHGTTVTGTAAGTAGHGRLHRWRAGADLLMRVQRFRCAQLEGHRGRAVHYLVSRAEALGRRW